VNAEVLSWLADIADRYPHFEADLPDSWPHSRRVTYSMFMLRAMTDGSCVGAAAALEWVDMVRAGMHEEAA
jgi:hypothetical protein